MTEAQLKRHAIPVFREASESGANINFALLPAYCSVYEHVTDTQHSGPWLAMGGDR